MDEYSYGKVSERRERRGEGIPSSVIVSLSESIDSSTDATELLQKEEMERQMKHQKEVQVRERERRRGSDLLHCRLLII